MQIYDSESFVNCKAAKRMIPFVFFIWDFLGNKKKVH